MFLWLLSAMKHLQVLFIWWWQFLKTIFSLFQFSSLSINSLPFCPPMLALCYFWSCGFACFHGQFCEWEQVPQLILSFGKSITRNCWTTRNRVRVAGTWPEQHWPISLALVCLAKATGVMKIVLFIEPSRKEMSLPLSILFFISLSLSLFCRLVP